MDTIFNFEVWYISGQRYTIIDELPCQPFIKIDLKEAEAKLDIDEFILAEQNYLQVFSISIDEPISILQKGYIKLS